MTGTDDNISIREFLEAEIASLRREVDTLTLAIKTTAEAHAESHAREHQMTQVAVSKAEESMTLRLEGMNQLRDQINSERGVYMTKAEMSESTKRLEEMTGRNAADLLKSMERVDERLKSLENFKTSFQAQIGTLRALVFLIPIVLAVVAFVLARIGQ